MAYNNFKDYTVRGISLRKDILELLDKKRGTLNRSAYINEVLYRHLNDDKKEVLA